MKHELAMSNNPLRGEVFSNFDSVFDQMFNEFFKTPLVTEKSSSYPRVDIIEENDKYIIEAEIPGLKKEDVSVEVQDNILAIKGNKQSRVENKDRKYVHRELKRSSFQRSFNLDETIDQDAIKGDFIDGILTIDVPKKKQVIEKSKVKKIL